MATSNTDIAGSHDITARRGDSFERTFSFKDSDDNPIDLSGHEFKCEVRDLYDKKRILSFTCIVHDTNQVTISKTASQMNVRAGRYLWDLVDVSAESIDIDKMAGVFTVTDDVTANISNPLEDEDGEVILVG